MDRREFVDYWVNTHGPIAARIPGLKGYRINVSHELPFPEDAIPWDGLVEIFFEDGDAFEAGISSREGVAAVADVDNFAERKGFLLTEETVIVPLDEEPDGARVRPH